MIKKNEKTAVQQDKVWIRAYPLSKAEKSFAAKFAPKWQGLYQVVEQVGPMNYKVVLETFGEDLKVVHISCLKPCYPNTQDLQWVLEILNEASDEEDFLGFPNTPFSARGWANGSEKEQEDNQESDSDNNLTHELKTH